MRLREKKALFTTALDKYNYIAIWFYVVENINICFSNMSNIVVAAEQNFL